MHPFVAQAVASKGADSLLYLLRTDILPTIEIISVLGLTNTCHIRGESRHEKDKNKKGREAAVELEGRTDQKEKDQQRTLRERTRSSSDRVSEVAGMDKAQRPEGRRVV